MLHYTPQHVSSSMLLSSSGGPIVSPQPLVSSPSVSSPYSMQVESGLQSARHLHTVRLLTEGDDTRGCGDTIGPLDDESSMLLETC